jgi:dipeptidyl aminopeptidase/acylaminoacyl peptidase
MRPRLLALLVLGACSSDSTAPPLPPVDGIIHVRFTTLGPDVDPNGYLVSIDGNARPTRADANGTVDLRLFAGAHRVFVNDVAPNCTVGAIHFVTIVAGTEMSYDIGGECTALGEIRVSVVTSGSDIDADGYRVWVSGVDFYDNSIYSLRTTETATVGRFAQGHHRVALQGLSANCSGDALEPRDVDVVSGGSVSVEFALTCSTPHWIAYSAGTPPLNADIYVVRSNGTDERRLTAAPGVDDEPAWSPDGTQIAFTSNRDGPRSVYVMNEDGSGVTRLTPEPVHNYRPAWSPDGTRIAFVGERDVGVDIYVMDRDGSNQRRLTTHPARDLDPAWSPDGTRIAFTSERDGGSRVYTMNADGSGVARVTKSSETESRPAWSRDGTRIAFTRKVCGGDWLTCYPALFSVSLGADEIEVGIGEDPAWSPDGRTIAVTRFACDFGYYATADNCTVAGIGIVGFVTRKGIGYVDTWEPELTTGIHRRPAWRP